MGQGQMAGHGMAPMGTAGGHGEGAPGPMGGVPGAMPGDGAPGGSGGQAPKVDEKNPYHPVANLVHQLQSGNFNGLDAYISEHATKEVLAGLRDGTLDDVQKETLREQIGQAKPLNKKNVGGDYNIYLQGDGANILTFLVHRKDGIWKIRDFSVRESRKLSRQQRRSQNNGNNSGNNSGGTYNQ